MNDEVAEAYNGPASVSAILGNMASRGSAQSRGHSVFRGDDGDHYILEDVNVPDGFPSPNKKRNSGGIDALHKRTPFTDFALAKRVGNRNPDGNASLFTPGTKQGGFLTIEKDLSAFKYEVKDNRRIQTVAVGRVFKKAGAYIFNLGLVNFFEYIIVYLLLFIYCYYNELKTLSELQKSPNQDRRLPFLISNVSSLTFMQRLTVLLGILGPVVCV